MIKSRLSQINAAPNKRFHDSNQKKQHSEVWFSFYDNICQVSPKIKLILSFSPSIILLNLENFGVQ